MSITADSIMVSASEESSVRLDAPTATPAPAEPTGADVRRVRLAATVTALGGLIVLAGWMTGIAWLRQPLPGVVDMKANTALGFVLCGVALWLLSSPARGWSSRLMAACALTVAALGAATVVEYGLDMNLGFDELLFADEDRSGRTVHPGRLAPQTAIAFLFCGGGLLLARRGPIAIRAAELLALSVAGIAILALTAYTYGVPLLAKYPGLTPIAPHTAALLLVLVSGLLTALRGPIAQGFTGPRSGSVMARKLLPLGVLIMPVIGWLRLEGEQRDLYGAAEGVALMVLVQLVAVSAGIVFVARALNAADAERERATEVERRLAGIVEASSEAIFGLDPAGLVTSWNGGAEKLFGYSAGDMLGSPVSRLAPSGQYDDSCALIAQVAGGRELSHHLMRRMRKDETIVEVAVTSAPIVRAGVVIGISVIAQDATAENRTKRELERRVEERTAALAQSRTETLQRLSLAAEYRDDDTYRHTERVGLLSALLGRAVGLDAAEVALLRQAAPLHDIGKVALPDAILLKRGRFTEEEFEAMKRHTVVGAQMLSHSRSAVLRMAEEIALTHHERWDGSGYPAGLQGEAIPLTGRIVAVADVFDALTHERPYKAAWSAADALSEITGLRGTHFDPRVVDALIDLDSEPFAALEEQSAPRPQVEDLPRLSVGRSVDLDSGSR